MGECFFRYLPTLVVLDVKLNGCVCVCCDFFAYHTSEELLKINITSTYFSLGCFES